MLHSLITVMAAVEEEESSKTLFYAAGALLVVFALVISAIGISNHETFPASRRTARAVMGLAVLLVAFTMASAVITG